MVFSSTLSVMVSVWIEGIFYGINVVVYFTCLYVVVLRQARGSLKIRRGLLVLSTILFISATVHMVINVRRLVEGYVLSPTKAAMNNYFGDRGRPLSLAHEFLIVITYFLSDLIITWRVHIVWGFNWRITLIPLVLSLSALTSGIGAVASTAIAQLGQPSFIRAIARFGDAWVSLALIMNVTATFLIASRIWWVTRHVSAFRTDSFPCESSSIGPGRTTEGAFNTWKRHNRRYWRLVVVIIESAACAAVMQVIQLAFYASKFPGVSFVFCPAMQVVAISPLLIIAFVGLTGDRTGKEWSTSVSYGSSSTAYGTGSRVQAVVVSGRGVGAAQRGGRLTGGKGTDELEFNVSFTETKNELGGRYSKDEDINPTIVGDTNLGNGTPSPKDEEVEMQCMAV